MQIKKPEGGSCLSHVYALLHFSLLLLTSEKFPEFFSPDPILCALGFSDRPRRLLKTHRARAPQVDLILKSPAPTNICTRQNVLPLRRDQKEKHPSSWVFSFWDLVLNLNPCPKAHFKGIFPASFIKYNIAQKAGGRYIAISRFLLYSS